MVYSASDIDYENLTTTFAWTDGAGTVLGTGSTLTLDNSRPVGSTITATVTTLDGYGASDSASETIVLSIQNPVLDQAAEIVSSPSPKTTGLLTCSAAFSDYNDGSSCRHHTHGP